MSRKRKSVHVPHQRKFSPQDIRDAGTPEGTAMLNEELRRIADRLAQLESATSSKESQKAEDRGGERSQSASWREVSSAMTSANMITTGSRNPDGGIAIYHNGKLVASNAHTLVFQDRHTSASYRVTQRDDGVVVVEELIGNQAPIRRASGLEVGIVRRATHPEGLPLRDAPDTDNRYAVGTYAIVPYVQLEYGTQGIESTDVVHIRVNREGVWNIQASLWVRAMLPYPTAPVETVLSYPRLVVLRNRVPYTVLDVVVPPYKQWRFEPWLPSAVRCPVAYHDVFLSGSQNLYFQAKDEVSIAFACNDLYDTRGSLVQGSVQRDGRTLLEAYALWGWFTAMWVGEHKESPTPVMIAGDPFVRAEIRPGECTAGTRGLFVRLVVEHNGQTVFLLPDEAENATASRLVINGVEYHYGEDYTITADPTRLEWNGPFALSTEDHVYLWVLGDIAAPHGGEYTTVREFEFPTPQTVWVVAHNLGRYPVVHVTTLGGAEIDAVVQHESENLLRVYHTTPMAGRVILAL
jgi:hypothetical protein